VKTPRLIGSVTLVRPEQNQQSISELIFDSEVLSISNLPQVALETFLIPALGRDRGDLCVGFW
jgi:hypothetical protein